MAAAQRPAVQMAASQPLTTLGQELGAEAQRHVGRGPKVTGHGGFWPEMGAAAGLRTLLGMRDAR